MAEAAVSFLVESLSQLLKYHAGLASGAEIELRQLTIDLKLLQAYLRDWAMKPKMEKLKTQIKEFVYELEETIDSHLTQEMAPKNISLSLQFLDESPTLAEKVKDLRIRHLKLLDDYLFTEFQELYPESGGSTMEEPRTAVEKVVTAHTQFRPTRSDIVVAFRDEEKTIMDYLIEPKEELGVICILGKTRQELARKICKSERISYEFPVRIWVHVSQSSNYRDVFLSIVKTFTSQDMSSLNDKELADTAGACLEKEKFLLVLDDLCSNDDWKALQHILPRCNSTSRVLMTSASIGTARTQFRATRSERVVGFKDEEETIMDYLIEPKEELGVISILGEPGQGKTTLAWKIYRNVRISYEFPIRIWTHVSRSSNYRDVFLNILKMFTSQDMSRLNDKELADTAGACLEKEKFLLVLDGLCSNDDWKALQHILPRSNSRSRVLITSCDDVVGADVNGESIQRLQFLTKEESWELLQLEVFGNLEDCPPDLEETGKLIAGKCGGLPHKIVVIGGLLTGQLMKSHVLDIKMEWQKVCEKEGLFLHDEKSTSKAIELTYSTMRDELRDCFLYMGVFPEGYEISVWELTRLWIAEGFIQAEDEQSLEEIAFHYLYDLINMNLLVAEKVNLIGEVKTCRVRSVVHEFCVDKARKQNLFQKIERSMKGGVPEPPRPELQNLFHEIERSLGVLESPLPKLQKSSCLCVPSHFGGRLLSEVPTIPRVRSILCFCNEFVYSNQRYTTCISDALILLRVLDSKSIKFSTFPARIAELIHLRYITLSVDDLNILPQSLSYMWNLQTLLIDTRSRLITMEANIWKLIQLRHLKTNAAIVLSFEGEGEGKASENLQTLTTLSPKSCTEDVSERSANLKTLRIRGELSTVFKSKFLENLVYLEKLKLVNDFFPETPHQNPLHGLPQPDCFPPSLRCLTLSNTYLKWNHMSTLAKIETLEVLKLKENAFVGIYWSAEDDCFCSLQFLLIANADLVIWEALTDSFPALRCLVLRNCENLNEFPVALTNLERLEIERVNKSAVILARRVAEERAKSGFPLKLSITPGS